MTGRARERRRREVTGKIGEGTVGGVRLGPSMRGPAQEERRVGPAQKRFKFLNFEFLSNLHRISTGQKYAFPDSKKFK
jgi:hypothetical protein